MSVLASRLRSTFSVALRPNNLTCSARPALQRPIATRTSGIAMALDKNTPETDWKKALTQEEYRILRQKGTERAGTGTYNKHKDDGVYTCAGCGTPLYNSNTKFDSGCGWPAYWDNIPGAVERTADPDGSRVEITCAKCGGHLGHVFTGERFGNPKDERHCVNSVSIKFDPKK